MQAFKDDGLPENICITCLSEINQAVSFKQKCERSDFTLKIYLQQTHMNDTGSKIESVQSIENISQHHQTHQQQELLQQILQTKLENKDSILNDLGDICYLKAEDTGQPSSSQENLMLFHKETSSKEKSAIESTEEASVDCDDNNDGDKYFINENECHKESSHILYHCQVCCEMFQFSEDLEQHVKFHSNNEKKDEPEHMNIDYNHAQDTDYEQKCKEKSLTNKPYKCDQCKTEFVHKKNFVKHMKKHDDTESVKDANVKESGMENTPHDDSDSSTNSNDAHLKPVILPLFQPPRTSTGLQCSKCGANFVKEKSLNIHQTLNKCTEKAFQCHICQRIFVRKRNLTRHMRTHSDKKEFPCTQCNREFRRQDQLSLHMKDHGTGRKHQCNFCPKGRYTNLIGFFFWILF